MGGYSVRLVDDYQAHLLPTVRSKNITEFEPGLKLSDCLLAGNTKKRSGQVRCKKKNGAKLAYPRICGLPKIFRSSR